MSNRITGDEAVDEILEENPELSAWLSERGIMCTKCGEVFWGSLTMLLESKGLSPNEQYDLIEEINSRQA